MGGGIDRGRSGRSDGLRVRSEHVDDIKAQELFLVSEKGRGHHALATTAQDHNAPLRCA